MEVAREYVLWCPNDEVLVLAENDTQSCPACEEQYVVIGWLAELERDC